MGTRTGDGGYVPRCGLGHRKPAVTRLYHRESCCIMRHSHRYTWAPLHMGAHAAVRCLWQYIQASRLLRDMITCRARTQVMHVATLAYLNFSFVVQHDTWAIHRPHKLAAAAAIALKQHDKAASADLLNAFDQHMRIRRRTGTAYQHYKHYAELKYTTARQAMRTAAYVPYQGPPFLNCLESLPWWRVPTEVLRSEAGRGGFEGWVAPGVGPEDDRGVPLPWPPPWRLVRLRQQQQQR